MEKRTLWQGWGEGLLWVESGSWGLPLPAGLLSDSQVSFHPNCAHLLVLGVWGLDPREAGQIGVRSLLCARPGVGAGTSFPSDQGLLLCFIFLHRLFYYNTPAFQFICLSPLLTPLPASKCQSHKAGLSRCRVHCFIPRV